MTDKAASSILLDEAALSVTYRIQACHCPLPGLLALMPYHSPYTEIHE